MRPVVLVGHQHQCPLHGIGVVETGSTSYEFNGRAVARIGDRISCGAVIISGTPNFTISGKSVARSGDRSDHGGILMEGDMGWLLD